jgi:hypothetical protein
VFTVRYELFLLVVEQRYMCEGNCRGFCLPDCWLEVSLLPEDPCDQPSRYWFYWLSPFLTRRRLMSYIYGAPILDVSRSHTTTQHSR